MKAISNIKAATHRIPNMTAISFSKIVKWFALLLLATCAHSFANVSVNIGTLPAGKTVRVKYQITVNNPLPGGIGSITNQGTVSGSNFSTVVTDDPATGTIGDPTVTTISVPPLLSNFSKTADEDTLLTFATTDFNSAFNDANSDTLTNVQVLTLPTNGTLKLNDAAVTLNQNIAATDLTNLTFIGATNYFGTNKFDWKATDSFGAVSDTNATITILVNPIADTPAITTATTKEDVQTTSGLVTTRNAADGPEVTHFKITSILNGTLFKNDGTTVITNGSFITFAEANAGLKFTPSTNFFGNGSFDVQASTNSADIGLGGSIVATTIVVSPVADTPSVTGASTAEDTKTSSGLVISRNAADGTEVTHFKITSINGGTLFKNDGTTVISSGTFVTFAEGNAGLKYLPATNANTLAGGVFNFAVQASTNATDSGLGGSVVTPAITVSEVNDAVVANADTLSSIPANSGAQSIPLANLLVNDSAGPANESSQILTVTAVTNAVGGTVVISGTNALFTPATNFAGAASFAYIVQDNGTTAGIPDPKTASAVASFTITFSSPLLVFNRSPFVLRVNGPTNVAYNIQSKTNLGSTNWQNTGTTTLGGSGLQEFPVTATNAAAFYRIAQ